MNPLRMATFALCLAATTAPTNTLPLLTKARHILSTLKESTYTHPTHIDESTNSYHCDCSGLIDYLLRQISPPHYALILAAPHHKRPLASDFYAAFLASPTIPSPAPSWQQIDHLSDARPGDILAWRRLELKTGQDTGHVMLIDSPPTPDGDNTFRVTVIDSTSSPHANDTRPPGTTGVGRGTLWFQVDPAGHPTGFRWKSNGEHFTSLPISIGRMIQDPP